MTPHPNEGFGPDAHDAPDASHTRGRDRFPWPPARGESAAGALIRCWVESVFRPRQFFRSMPVPGPIGPAFLYYLIVGVVAAAINLYWSSVARVVFGTISGQTLGLEAWSPLLNFLFAPIGLVLGISIAFVVIHLMLLILGGARQGAGTTFRVLCYSYGPTLFSIVPVLGGLVGSIWLIVLCIIGLREAHRTDGWRVGLAIVLPVVLLIVGLTFLVVLVVAAIFAAL